MEKLAGWIYDRLEAMQRKPDKILYNEAVKSDLRALEPAGNIRLYAVALWLSASFWLLLCG